jgi:hypothetical protein
MMVDYFSRASRVFAVAAAMFAAPAFACSGRLHVEIAAPGIYALDYASIVAAQPQLQDCRASDLMLLHQDKEVPIRVSDDGNGALGPGSRIEWVGEPLHGPQSWFDPYSNVNVYQLAAAPGAHARVRELAPPASAQPAALSRRVHFEQENLMVRLGDQEMKPGDEPDVWQWAKLTPIDPQPFTFDFDLPDADLRAHANATMTVDFRGESNIGSMDGPKPADHRVEVLLDDKPIQNLEWDGRGEQRMAITVPLSALRAGTNRLSLRVARRDLPGDAKNFIVDVVMFNWFEITYPIRGIFDSSAAAFTGAGDAPIEFTYGGIGKPIVVGNDGIWRNAAALGNARYRAAGASDKVELYAYAGDALKPVALHAVADGDLRHNAGYDYLIVAHPRLRSAIEPLAQFHREHGMKVAVVDVNDVYDQFNGGIIHPSAIRDFVAWGVEHWQTKPRYLLLVGDASVDIHHDIRNKTVSGSSMLAPRAQPRADQLLTPGGGFAYMKTTAYSQQAEDLPNRNLIPTWQVATSMQGQSASDNPFVAFHRGDIRPAVAVGRFPVVEPEEVKAIVEKTIAYLSKPPSGRWRRDMTFISSSEVESFKGASDKLARDLENQGYAVRNIYTDFNDKDAKHVQGIRATLKQDLDDGNLLVHFLGHGGSYIWRVGPIGDLFALDDVSAMKNVGRYPLVLAMTCFSAPFDSPAEDSIGERFLREPGKGAVAVFAASWSNSPNPAYSRDLIERLLQPGATVGDAIKASKNKIADPTFVQMYNLLGDPALVLARPQSHIDMAAASDRWDPRVVVRFPDADFGGIVDVDWVDASGQILNSRRYEARNAQFYLPLPDEAKTVLVYAVDTRHDTTAFGSFARPEPPAPPAPPKPTTKAATAKPAVPAVSAAPPRPTPAVPARNLPDIISQRHFDAPDASGGSAHVARKH